MEDTDQSWRERYLKLKEAVVILRTRSTDVQNLCASQQLQYEDLQRVHQRREAELLRRCELAEDRLRELEAKLQGKQLPAQGATGDVKLPASDGNIYSKLAAELHDISQAFDRAGRVHGVSHGLTHMQTATTSLCEGALGVLRATLAAEAQQGNAIGPSALPRIQAGECGSACMAQSLVSPSAADENSQDFQREQTPAQDPDPCSRDTQQQCRAQAVRLPAEQKEREGLQVPPTKRKRSTGDALVCSPQLEHSLGANINKTGKINSHLQGEGLTAVDIAQHWIEQLFRGSATQEHVQHVAAELITEIDATRRCHLSVIVGCIISAICECKHEVGGLRPDSTSVFPDEDVSSIVGPPPLVGLQANAAVEEVAFCGAWYGERERHQHRLSVLMSCIASMEALQDDAASPGTGITQAIQQELARLVLVNRKKPGPGQDCEDCALTTSLALLYRMQGRWLAMRGLLLDLLLLNGACGSEAMLPCLAAALTTWPDVLSHKHHHHPSTGTEIICLIQVALKDLCSRILCKTPAQPDDVTLPGCISNTTISAAACSGRVAALHLWHLGKQFWGWQEYTDNYSSGLRELGAATLNKMHAQCLQASNKLAGDCRCMLPATQILGATLGLDFLFDQVARNNIIALLHTQCAKDSAQLSVRVGKYLLAVLDDLLALAELLEGEDRRQVRQQMLLDNLKDLSKGANTSSCNEWRLCVASFVKEHSKDSD